MQVVPVTADDWASLRAARALRLWLSKRDLRKGLLWLIILSDVVLSLKSYNALTWYSPSQSQIDPLTFSSEQARFFWMMGFFFYVCTLLFTVLVLSACWLTWQLLLRRMPHNETKLIGRHLMLFYVTLGCIVGMTCLGLDAWGTSYITPLFWEIFIGTGLLCSVKPFRHQLFHRANLMVIHCCLLVWLFWGYYANTIGNWVDVTQ
jgi:hypothetical protein